VKGQGRSEKGKEGMKGICINIKRERDRDR
jgi:hypothetical protein